jgi:WD40 repeat protein
MSRDALVVGINLYTQTSLGNLLAPAKDAEAIAQQLSQYGGFTSVRRLPEVELEGTIRVGQKTKVTLNELEEAIGQLFNPSGQNLPETALLFFSGHGLRKEKGGIQEGFLATSDANPNGGFYGLSLQWLRRLLQESPIRQQIVCLDCCYSGELFNFAEADPGDRGKGRDRCFISASREFEAAYEETGGRYGVLTAALLQGLDPKRQPNGLVTNFTLSDFLKQVIPSSPQRPICNNSGGEIILTGEKVASATPVEGGICPYKGLEYFDFNDEDPKYFFGRTTLTDQLLEKVRLGNFLAVMGASGSGKSSGVRAGLLYQLKLGQRLSGSDRWVIKILRLGNYPRLSEYPLRCLAQVFVDETLSEIDQASQSAKAEALLETGAIGLGHLIQAFKAERVILAIDQFEEVFTLCKDRNERQRFFECLLKAVEALGTAFTLVLALRADFYGKCAEKEYAGLAKKIQDNLVTVIPMSEGELIQAIVEPAKQVNLDVERELATQMIRDVADSPGSLPLLAYTLRELWQQRTVERLMLSAYTRLGGIQGTLEKRATEVYESLPQEEQRTAKHIFLALTQLGEWAEVTRRRVLKQELITPQYSVALIDRVIQKFAGEDIRLLVTGELVKKGEESGRIAVIDVAHEALIRHWPLLHKWVDDNRDALRKKRSIEEDAQEWLAKEKSEDYLLRGTKLSEATDFDQRDADSISLSSLGQEFVKVSQVMRDRLNREEEERRQRELKQERKARRAAQGTALAVIVGAIVVALFGAQAEQRKNTAIKALIAEPQRLLETNNQLEALIASVEALKQLKDISGGNTNTPPSLISVINKVQERNRLEKHKAPVVGISFSPDGKKIVSGGVEGVMIWEKSGKLIRIIPTKDQVWGVTFSHDGTKIISTNNDGIVRIWSSGEEFFKHEPLNLSGHIGKVFAVASRQDSEVIATSGDDGTIRLWDINSTSRNQNFQSRKDESVIKDKGTIYSIDFSPNNKYIASTGYHDGKVKIWDFSERGFAHSKPIIELDFSESSKDKNNLDNNIVSSVSFSPDGSMLAASNYKGFISIWSVKGWNKINEFHAHTDQIYSISFSPDSKIIAAASRETENRLAAWSLDGTNIANFIGHTQTVNQVKFQPENKNDGHYVIASSSDDSTIRIWNLDRGKNNTSKDKEIDNLLLYACSSLSEYLKTNENIFPSERRKICK